MKTSSQPIVLDVFCARLKDGWQIDFALDWVPPFLKPFLDRHHAATVLLLDFDDLEEHMAARGAVYEKRPSKLGGVQLRASGPAAKALAEWLATAFASGLRSPAGNFGPSAKSEG